MSVWDWVDCGLIDKDVHLPAMTGSFNVTIGDALSGTFGAQHNHIFGAYTNLICDPEDILMGKLEHYLPGVAALLSGVGGNTCFTYASQTQACYIGPVTTIQRAPVVSKTTDYCLPRLGIGGNVPTAADPIDASMLAAVAVLSVLIVAVPAALELAIRFKYPQYGHEETSGSSGSGDGGDGGEGGGSEHTEGDGYGKAPEIMKLCAYMVTSRLMALLKMLEDKGSWAQFAEQWCKEAEYLGVRLAVAGLACIPLYGWCGLLVWDDKQALTKTLESTKNALLED